MFTAKKNPPGLGFQPSYLLIAFGLACAAQGAHAATCSTAPGTPTGLTANGTVGRGTFLNWTSVAPPANCTTSYTVLMNGTSIGTANTNSFAVTGLTPATAYSFTVEATDADGASAASSAVPVTTAAEPSGSVRYVSKSGSDSANGTTPTTAWLTISHAAANVSPGDTVYVGAGTYNESVPITISGTAAAPIVFDGQGVAIVDGTGVACCTEPTQTTSGWLGNTQGLFSIANSGGLSYVTLEGFTVQNYKTTSNSEVPAGILIADGGSNINVIENVVQNIQNTGKETSSAGPNAYGIGVFGTITTPLSVNVSYNTVTGCLTGESETTTYNGNVQDFTVSYNTIHDNDNIAMDAIGFEGVGPSGLDQAKNGDVFGNVIYNNSAVNNAGEQGYDDDGLYCDGCTQVVFERNLVYANDIGIEAASETSGEVSSDVIIRNNVVYGSNSAGMTVGGYAKSGTGGSTNITIVNNSLYNDDLQNTGSGEFQIQYRTTGVVFENNSVYPGVNGLFLFGYVKASGVTLNYNDYYTTSSTTSFEYNATSYPSFAAYQKGSKQDAASIFANPGYDSLPVCSATGITPPGGFSSATAASCTTAGNLDISSSSLAVNAGNNALGTPAGSGYSDYETSAAFVGSTDFNGNARVNSGGLINIGAFEQ